MTEFRIEKMQNKEVSANIMSAYKKIEGEWKPAIFKGQTVDSKIYMVFDIKPMGVASTVPKILNSLFIQVLYYGVKRGPIEVRSTSSPYGSLPRR